MFHAESECACFSLCHPEEVRHFFIRLPIVTHETSPWFPYLLAVYHTVSVPLPFDLRTLAVLGRKRGLYGRPAQRPKLGCLAEAGREAWGSLI